MPQMIAEDTACGRCSKPMPTERVKITKGRSIKVVVNGVVMPSFYVGYDLEFGFCVRCKTHTPVQSQ